MKPTDHVTYWRDPEFTGIEISRIDGSRHVFPDHAHDDIYAIGLMETGGSYCRGPSKSDSLVWPGQVALINPGQVHSGVPVSGKRISYRMVYFDLTFVASVTAEICRRPPIPLEFPCMVLDDRRLWGRLLRLCRVIQSAGGRLEKESAVMDVLAGMVPFCSPATPIGTLRRGGETSMRHAMEFLSENLDRKLSLESVAQTAGLSRYHFLRVFKRETGLSPHLFRTLRRIERAKSLLRGGTPLAETALMVGFSDQSHFTNTFRKYTGATPGQYLCDASH